MIMMEKGQYIPGTTDDSAVRRNSCIESFCTVKRSSFWSWGYGYLYDVKTTLLVNGRSVDEVVTRTGFRKTRFGEGKVWLNDRVLQLKGYAQRSSNEWPGVGMSVPPWMSDYSNGLMIEHNANLFGGCMSLPGNRMWNLVTVWG